MYVYLAEHIFKLYDSNLHTISQKVVTSLFFIVEIANCDVSVTTDPLYTGCLHSESVCVVVMTPLLGEVNECIFKLLMNEIHSLCQYTWFTWSVDQ